MSAVHVYEKVSADRDELRGNKLTWQKCK
jgi:hypothetical protein